MNVLGLVRRSAVRRILATFCLIPLSLGTVPLRAADFYWDPDETVAGNQNDGTNLGGIGIWNTSTLNWWDTAGMVAWPNNNTGNAIFTYAYPSLGIPSPNTVTVDGGGVTANRLTFERSGYTISGGAITLAGTGAGLHANLGESATISSQILGTDGLTKTGGGAIRLTNNANSYTGTTTISNGSLVITGQGALGADTSAIVVTEINPTIANTGTLGFSGGSLVLDGSGAGFAISRDLSLQGGGPINSRSGALQSFGNNTLSGLVRLSAGTPGFPTETFRNTRIVSSQGLLTLSGTLDVTGVANSTVDTLGGVNTAGTGSSYALTGVLTGNTYLEKSGGGTLFLTPSDTSGFSGRIRVSGSATFGQSEVRITGNNVVGSRTSSTTNGVLDLSGGLLGVRMDTPMVQTTGGTDANVYGRSSSTLFFDHAIGSNAQNGTATFGNLSYEDNITLTFNSRNGYGASFTTAPVNGGNANSTITNNMGGLLSFTGNFWSNADNGANRTMTIGGNGNTLIDGNIIASAAAFNHNLTKTGNGFLRLTGAASTLDGTVNVSGGVLNIRDFRSINNNNGTINIGSGGTSTNLVIGVEGFAPTAAGLTTSKVINLAGTTGSATIYANQSGADPVVLNGDFTTTGGSATNNKNLFLGGTNTADNIIFGSIENQAGATTGQVSLQKRGAGTWVLAGENTFTGATTIVQGTLKLQANAPTSTILPAANDISFGNANVFAGGTLEFVGQDGVNNVQNLDVLSFTSGGASTIKLTPGVGGTASLAFANINTGGTATLNFVGGDFTNNTFTITNVNAAAGGNGILTRSVYWNGADFAYREGGVLRAPNYGVDGDTATSATALTAGQHNEITGSFSTPAGALAVDTLKFNGGHTLTLDSTQTLTISAFGLLATGGESTITGGAGSSIATAANQPLVIRANEASDSITLDTVLTGNGGFTKSGAGTLILSQANTQTGTMHLAEGAIRLTSGAVLSGGGTTSALTMRQGTVLDLNGVSVLTGIDDLNSNGTVTNTSATPVTFTVGNSNGGGTSFGIISETAGQISVSKLGNGAQSWLGQSTYTGVTTIGGSTAGIVTVDWLGDGGMASGIGASSSDAGNLVFNGTGGGLQYAGSIRDGDLVTGARSTSTDRLFTLAGSSATIASSAAQFNSIVWSNTGDIAFSGAGNRALRLSGSGQGDNVFRPRLTDNGGDPFSLTKVGTGIWKLDPAVANTYTGATTITQGFLQAVDGVGIPTASNIVLDGGSLVSSGTFTRTLGTGAGQYRFAAPANANEAEFIGGFTAGDSKLTVNFDSNPVWGATAGFLSNRDGLILNGSQARAQGTTGSIALSEVEITGDFSLGSASGAAKTLAITTANSSATATVTTGDTSGLVVGQSITGPNIASGAYITSINSATQFTMSANASAATAVNRDIVANNLRPIRVDDNTNSGSDFATISGNISAGDSVTGIRKVGNGVLRLTGANTYQGETNVNQGLLSVMSLGSSAGVGSSSVGADGVPMTDANAVTLGNGGTGSAGLQYLGAGETSDRKIRLFSTTGSTQIHADGSGPLVLTNVVNDLGIGNKTLFLRGTNTGGNMISSVLADNGGTLAVAVDSSATWILTGANTYTGNTTNSAGALGLGNDQALGGSTLVMSNGNLFAYGADRTIANTVNLNNNVSQGFIGDHSLTFTQPLSILLAANNGTINNNVAAGKAVTFAGATANNLTGNRTLTIDGSGTTILDGNITTDDGPADVRGLNITKTGTGVLEIRGSDAFSNWSRNNRVLDLDGGTLRLGASEVIPDGFDDQVAPVAYGGITLSPEAANGIVSVFDLNGHSETINALTATTNGVMSIDNTGATPSTLTFGGADADANFGTGTSTGTYNITDSGPSTLSIAKIGTGTATIGGGAGTTNLDYTGTTSVTGGGILNIAAPLSSTTGITVDGGSTLNLVSGTGNPLALTSLSLGAGSGTSILGLELGPNSAGSDVFNVSNPASVQNTVQFDITALAGFGTSSTYDLITAPSGLTSGGATYVLGNLPGGFTYSLNNSDALIQLQLAALAAGDVFWRGDANASWSSVVGGNSNFSTDLAGTTDLGAAPGSLNTVIFSATPAPFTSTTVIDTTLDNNFFIDSLEFTAAPAGITAVTIATGTVTTNTLTITPSSNSNGIDVADNAGAIAISAPVVLGADQTWNVVGTGANGSSLTLSGTLTGTSALTKTGAGTTTLSGDFTGFTGGIAINGGVLEVARTGTFDVSNLITGTGALTKSASGVMTINNDANTFAGPVTITGGTLNFTTIGNVGAGATSMGAPTNAAEGTISLSGTLGFVGGASQSTDRLITQTTNSTLRIGGTGGASVTYTGAITAAGFNLTLGGTTGSEGFITGGITQTGTTADMTVNGGIWTLSGSTSTIADDLTVTGTNTVLNLNSAGSLALGDSTNASLRVYSGATINLGADDAVNPTGFDGLRVGVDSGGAAVATFNMNGFNQTVNEFILGNRTLDREGLVDGTGTLTVTGNLDVYEGTINANLKQTGTGTFQKIGHETVTLRGFYDSTGATTGDTLLEDGTLVLDYTVNNNHKINSGQPLDMRGGNLILNGNNSAATSQVVSAFLLGSGGFNTITLNQGTGGDDVLLTLGDITRANSAQDATIRFNLPAGAQSATNGITTNSPNSLFGTLGNTTTATSDAAYATVNDGSGTWFATKATAATGVDNIVGLASTAKNDVTTWAAGDHITDETSGFTGFVPGSSINTLRFNAAGGSALNLASDGVLLVRSGGILATDQVTSGAPGIFGGTLVSDVTELIVHQDSSQTFEISSFLGSTQGITKSGAGTLLLSGSNNNYQQETEIHSGTLQVSGGNALSDISIVTLASNRNSTLQLLADETIGRLQGGKRVGVVGGDYGTVAIGGNTLRVLNTSSTTYAGFITGDGTLIKDGSADLNLQNTSSGFTGSIVIDGGTLRLSNAATIAASDITVNKGGVLFLDMSSTTRSTARILNTTPITLNSADGTITAGTTVRGLAIYNDQDGTADEAVGIVNVNSGASYVGMGTAGTNDDSDIIADNILRFNDATLNVRGTALGSTAARNNQFRIGTAANQTAFIANADNLVGGGGAAGSTNISIVPWAIGESFTGNLGVGNMGNSLVTYVSGAGFRPLDFTTEYSTFGAAAATGNVRESLAADLTGVSNTAVNALVIDNQATATVNVMGATQALEVTSGALLFTVSGTTAAATNYSTILGGFDAGITVGGTNEYVVSVVNPNNQVAIGTATGATATHSTRVTVSSTAGLVPGMAVFGQGIPVGATVASVTSATVFEMSLPADLAFSSQTFRFSDRGELATTIDSPLTSNADITKSGRGTLILTSVNTAGGGANKTTINEGTLQIADLDNIGGGTGGLVFAGGALRLGAGFTDDISTRSISFLQGGGTIDTNGIDLALASSIGSGVGGLTKTGTGNLTLNATSTRTGFTRILGGTVTVGANDGLGVGGDVGIGAGSTLDIGTNHISVGQLKTFGIAPLLTGTGTITASNGYFFTHESGTVTVDAILAGTGGLFKYEGGTTTLNGANTYSGPTEIQIGTLVFNSIANVGGGASALGAPTTVEEGTINTGFGGNDPVLAYTGTGHSTDRTIQMNGTANGNLTLQADGTGALGLGTVQSTISGNKTLFLNGSSDPSIVNSVGEIREVGSAITLNKSGVNTWMVNAAGSYTGATQVDNGILMLGLDNALPTGTALRIGTGTTAGTLDLNGFNQTIGSLVVNTTTNTVTNQLIVDTGNTLTVNGAVTVGPNANNANTAFNALGGGAVVVNSGGGNFIVGSASGGTNDSRVNADFSGLGSLTAQLGAGIFRLGDGNSGTEDNPSTLKLAVNNTITASAIRVGDGGGGGSPTTHTLTLGSGTNLFNADTFNIGSAGTTIRSGGAVVFDGGDTTGSLTVRASDGTGRATVNLINTTGSTASSMEATLDLAGHTADILASTLTMASRTQNSGAGTATLSFDQGTLDVTTLNMASRTGTGTGNATATLNLGDSAALGTPTTTIGTLNMAVNTSSGGTVSADLNLSGGNVTIGTGSGTAINMANAGTGRTVTSTINLTGGNLSVTGDIVRSEGGGTENATITVNGGVLDLNGHDLGGATGVITLDAQAGTLRNLGELNGGGTLTKSTAGTLVLEGDNNYTGATRITGGILSISSEENLGDNPAAFNAAQLEIDGGTLQTTASFAIDDSNRGITIGASGGMIETSASTALTIGSGNAIVLTGNLGKSGSGALYVNSTTTGTGAVTVSEGILGGTGSISGATTVQSGASLTGGTDGTVGTLTFTGDLTTDSGSTWLIDLVQDVNGSSDQISVASGSLNLNSATLSLGLTGDYTVNNTYTIATFNSLAGTFNGLSEGSVISGYTINYGTVTSGAITLTAVPEPGTLGLLGLALGGFFLRRRKRRASANEEE